MGDYGNAGRGTFRGPRFFNIDASLVKSFALTERKRVVFRAEAYNLINNVNFALTAASFDLTSRATFGKISGVASNPRLLQGALRFEWEDRPPGLSLFSFLFLLPRPGNHLGGPFFCVLRFHVKWRTNAGGNHAHSEIVSTRCGGHGGFGIRPCARLGGIA